MPDEHSEVVETVEPAIDRVDARAVRSELHIALRLAKSMPPGVTADDCIAFALEGLAEAAQRWDPSQGPLLQFARPRIHGAVVDGVRAATGIHRCEVRAGKRALQIVRDADEVGSDEIHREAPPVFAAAAQSELATAMAQHLAALPQEQQDAVRAVYFDGRSQADYAKELGLDRSAVCRRIAAAFATLRNVMAPWQDFAA